jgi:GntR family transcriptional regulator, transcriptional repressor for pyruvate dehydrogenase complex
MNYDDDHPRADSIAANALRAAILRGEHPVGSKLPGERELSARLGVSRATLRAAITRLQGEGFLRAVHGSGTVVRDIRETGGIELIGHMAAIEGLGSGDAVALLGDLLELRRTLAVEAVGLAAERCTDAELLALRSHVGVQRGLRGEPRSYVASDLALARRFAGATHNLALVLAANTLVRMLERQPGIELAFLVQSDATLRFYDRVLTLIEQRDAPAARRYARVLIERLDRHMLARLRDALGRAAAPAPSPTPAPETLP